MPVIAQSSYRASGIYRSSHLNTIHAGVFRKVDALPYTRERIDTYDGDFLNLDWIQNQNDRLVILLHGLEGDSSRPYMTGMAKYFAKRDWDVLAMNFRGCGGEPNALPRSYHIGETKDLDQVIDHAQLNNNYETIALIGFSVGGNIVLKYVGEKGEALNDQIKCAVAFSVPCHMNSAQAEIEKWFNWHYRKNLVDALNETYKMKMEHFPDQFQLPEKGLPKNFREFDEHYTAPIHGFGSAEEYWDVNSSIHFIPDIQIPTLLVNALDDSFLSSDCYPKALAETHPFFHLEVPDHGGHLGFVSQGEEGSYWTERRAFEFMENVLD